MFWFRFLIGIFLFLMFVYYVTVVAQALGVLSMTDEEISLKGLLPFYYWNKLLKKQNPNSTTNTTNNGSN